MECGPASFEAHAARRFGDERGGLAAELRHQVVGHPARSASLCGTSPRCGPRCVRCSVRLWGCGYRPQSRRGADTVPAVLLPCVAGSSSGTVSACHEYGSRAGGLPGLHPVANQDAIGVPSHWGATCASRLSSSRRWRRFRRDRDRGPVHHVDAAFVKRGCGGLDQRVTDLLGKPLRRLPLQPAAWATVPTRGIRQCLLGESFVVGQEIRLRVDEPLRRRLQRAFGRHPLRHQHPHHDTSGVDRIPSHRDLLIDRRPIHEISQRCQRPDQTPQLAQGRPQPQPFSRPHAKMTPSPKGAFSSAQSPCQSQVAFKVSAIGR